MCSSHLARFFVPAALMLAIAGCSSSNDTAEEPVDDSPVDQSDGVVFGSEDNQCPSTTLHNEIDDDRILAAAVNCFFAEYDAGRPVVWDLDIPTVEGDPIYYRFDFDGDTVTIIADNRLDTFGTPHIEARRCAQVERNNSVPQGVNCDPIEHDGFVAAS